MVQGKRGLRNGASFFCGYFRRKEMLHFSKSDESGGIAVNSLTKQLPGIRIKYIIKLFNKVINKVEYKTRRTLGHLNNDAVCEPLAVDCGFSADGLKRKRISAWDRSMQRSINRKTERDGGSNHGRKNESSGNVGDRQNGI